MLGDVEVVKSVPSVKDSQTALEPMDRLVAEYEIAFSGKKENQELGSDSYAGNLPLPESPIGICPTSRAVLRRGLGRFDVPAGLDDVNGFDCTNGRLNSHVDQSSPSGGGYCLD